MKILGIDPGSLKMGFALIDAEGRKFKHLDSGVIFYPKVKDFISKLGLIYQSCTNLIAEHNPDEIAVESLIFVKNISSMTKLSQARGAMLASFCLTHTGYIFEYPPTLIKSSVSGHGHSDKLAVEKTLKMIFGEINFKTDDQSDALAIALTHALHRNTKNIPKKSQKGKSLRDGHKDTRI